MSNDIDEIIWGKGNCKVQIDKIRDESTDDFFKTILQLESIEEGYAFFDDLLTLNEVKTMTQRYQVAKMLYEHKTYSEIEQATRASTATISRVKRSVFDGNGMYDVLFKRVQQESENENK